MNEGGRVNGSGYCQTRPTQNCMTGIVFWLCPRILAYLGNYIRFKVSDHIIILRHYKKYFCFTYLEEFDHLSRGAMVCQQTSLRDNIQNTLEAEKLTDVGWYFRIGLARADQPCAS
jgi:hypothetical protein